MIPIEDFTDVILEIEDTVKDEDGEDEDDEDDGKSNDEDDGKSNLVITFIWF